MAFMSRAGNLLRQHASKLTIDSGVSSSSPSLLQAVRHMSSSKIFIGGLSYSTDDMSLKEACSAYGEVVETKVILDRETGRSRGFGFVSFASSDEAASAVQALDGQDLHGRRVRVNYATDRVGGFRSQGGYGNSGYGGGNTGGYGGGGGAYNANTDGGYGANFNNRENVADGTNSFGSDRFVGGEGGPNPSSNEFNIRDAMGAGEFGHDTPVEEANK